MRGSEQKVLKCVKLRLFLALRVTEGVPKDDVRNRNLETGNSRS